MSDFDDDFDDPLDLLDDDGDGVIEMSLLEEEEKHEKGGRSNKTGCSVIFFMLGSMISAGWYVIQLV